MQLGAPSVMTKQDVTFDLRTFDRQLFCENRPTVASDCLRSSKMAAVPRYLSSSARSLACPLQQAARPNFSIPSFLYPPQQQFRAASGQGSKSKSGKAGAKTKSKSKNKKSKEYKEYDLTKAIQFSLCDAMRFASGFSVSLSRATKLNSAADPKAIAFQIYPCIRSWKGSQIR